MLKPPVRNIRLSPEQSQEFMRKKSRRAFFTAAIAGAAGIGGYEWLRSRSKEQMVPWPQQSVLRFNEGLAHGYLSDAHLAPTYSRRQVTTLKENGDYGLDDDVDTETWRLELHTPAATTPLKLSLADIQALPRVTQIVSLHCIEGWRVVVEWTGARFSDFTKRYFPPGTEFSRYVSMATPDSGYYVGLDIKSALHPQTLLCYEMNGAPLEEEHGAPLRLVIPVKYGIKNIKRIGSIRYTDVRPNDYWAEQGYDWFAGL